MAANKLAISSLSLGQHPSHTLDQKIRVAGQHGFAGIEIIYSDLKAYAESQQLSVLEGAEKVNEICAENQVEILSLAPFGNFEGHQSPIGERLLVAKHWIDVARKLGALYLQAVSQFDDTNCTGDQDVIISELQQLADLGSTEQPTVAIAYEALSWGAHCSTWEDSLRVVEAVDRPNFGLCLDNFHVVTKLWASAFEPSGKYPNADRDLADSLDRFRAQCPLDRIFYVQFSDGERFDPPFSPTHPWYLEGEAPEYTWSKHARPFPLETELGGYMPVAEIAKAWIVDKGFTGWVSLEVFDRRMQEAAVGPEIAAPRAEASWRRLQHAMKP